MAIPKHLRLEFVTPERAIAHEDVDEVELPGLEGYLGVLPGHAPLLAALKTGEMWYRRGGEKKFSFGSNTRSPMTLIVAERAEDIDLARAEAAKRRAEERLARPGVTEMDFERARIALLRAITRLQVSRHPRMRG